MAKDYAAKLVHLKHLDSLRHTLNYLHNTKTEDNSEKRKELILNLIKVVTYIKEDRDDKLMTQLKLK